MTVTHLQLARQVLHLVQQHLAQAQQARQLQVRQAHQRLQLVVRLHRQAVPQVLQAQLVPLVPQHCRLLQQQALQALVAPLLARQVLLALQLQPRLLRYHLTQRYLEVSFIAELLRHQRALQLVQLLFSLIIKLYIL